MRVLRHLKPKVGKEIPFLILVTFLATFAGSRAFTALFPNLFINIKGVHIHHFAYGFILLSLVGFLSLIEPRSPKTNLKLSLLFGFSLGIAFDEFAMWIQLDNIYHDRSTYDAIIVITLLLLNITYFEDFWKKWGHRLNLLVRRIVN